MNSSDTHEERIAMALADLRWCRPQVRNWRLVPPSLAVAELSVPLDEILDIVEETLEWCAQGVPATAR